MVGRKVFLNGSGTASESQHFVYDGGEIVLTLQDNGAVANRYLWGPAVDELLAQENSASTTYWALTDNLGTPRDWVNNAGTVVDHAVYDSFGRRTNAESIDAAFEWTGRYRDPLTGLQYNNARWYNPAIQRWMSEDPIGFAAGDANLSRYVGNAATEFVDPSGLKRVIGDPSKSDGTVIIIGGGGFGTGMYIDDMLKVTRRHNLAVIVYDSQNDANALINDKIPDNAKGLIMAGHGASDVFCDLTPELVADKIKEFKKLDFFVMRGCHSQDFLNNVNKKLLKDGKNMLGSNTFTISNYGYIASFHLLDHAYLDEFLSGKRTGNDDVINHNIPQDALGIFVFEVIGSFFTGGQKRPGIPSKIR